jgi:hypothetical protein
METHLYTHQLRKGKKRKKLAPAGTSAPSIADLLGLGLTAGQAALFIAKYFPK